MITGVQKPNTVLLATIQYIKAPIYSTGGISRWISLGKICNPIQNIKTIKSVADTGKKVLSVTYDTTKKGLGYVATGGKWIKDKAFKYKDQKMNKPLNLVTNQNNIDDTNNNEDSKLNKTQKAIIALTATSATVGITVTVFPWLGFCTKGIVLGSKATGWQAAVANVAVGRKFALLQSLGAKSVFFEMGAAGGIGLVIVPVGYYGYKWYNKKSPQLIKIESQQFKENPSQNKQQ